MTKVYATKRKAKLDYTLLKTFEAGIVLTGPEVKSIKSNKIDITGATCLFKDGRLRLINADIAPYQPDNMPEDYNPLRDRDLLLSKKELNKIARATEEKKLTIVPISVYNKAHLIKVEIALAKRKKKKDKREYLKKKDAKREMKSHL